MAKLMYFALGAFALWLLDYVLVIYAEREPVYCDGGEPVYPIDPDYSHVFPTNDTQEHVLVGPDCPCKPRIELEGASLIVVHNSFDRREVIEQSKWN